MKQRKGRKPKTKKAKKPVLSSPQKSGVAYVWSPLDNQRSWGWLLDSMKVEPEPDIVEWAESNYSLALIKSAAHRGYVTLRPWQVAYLREWQRPEVRKTVIMARSRTNKTTLVDICMAYAMRFWHVPCGFMLESDTKATNHWKDEFSKALEYMPYFQQYFTPSQRKFRQSGPMYRLPMSSIVLLGSGKATTQITLCVAAADEIDQYCGLGGESALPNYIELETRTDTWDTRKVTLCSRPTTTAEHTVHHQWSEGSRGVWHIACVECGEGYPTSKLGHLDLKTGRYVGLQWRKHEDGRVDSTSIRFICPRCGFEHTEDMSERMNMRGFFVHENEDNRSFRTFCIGGLGLWYLDKCSWYNMANAQEHSGKDATPTQRQWFYNEVLGRGYDPPKSQHTDRAKLLQSRVRPVPDNFRPVIVVAGTDTQRDDTLGKKYWVSVALAIDSDGNSYQAEWIRHDDIMQMEQWLRNRTYFGRKIELQLIDKQGASTESQLEDVIPYIKRNHPVCVGYIGEGGAGTSGTSANGWRRDAGNPLLFRFLEKKWKAITLDSLYVIGTESLTLNPKNTQDFIEQLSTMMPPKSKPTAPYEQWDNYAQSRNDAFDALKMAMIAKELVADLGWFMLFPQLAPINRWPNELPPFISKRVKEQYLRRQSNQSRINSQEENATAEDGGEG